MKYRPFKKRPWIAALLMLLASCATIKVPKGLSPAQQHLFRAKLHYQHKAWGKAARHLSQALLLDDTLLEAHRERLRVAIRQNRLKESTEELRRRLAARGETDHRALYALGLALYLQGKEKRVEGIFYLKKAVECAPHQADYHYRLGLALLNTNGPASALKALSQSIQLAPSVPSYQVTYAAVLYRLGQLSKVIVTLRAFSQLKPKKSELDRARQLAGLLTDPFRDTPKKMSRLIQSAAAFLSRKDLPSPAIKSLESLVQVHPNLGAAYLYLGLAHARVMSISNAVHALKRAAALLKYCPIPWYHLALLYHRLKRPLQTFQAINRAVAIGPLHLASLEFYGDLRLSRNEPQKAMAAYRLVATAEPNNQQARRKLARAAFATGELTLAHRIYQGIMIKEPKNIEAHLALGKIYNIRQLKERAPAIKARLKARARKHFLRVLELNPKNSLARKLLEKTGNS